MSDPTEAVDKLSLEDEEDDDEDLPDVGELPTATESDLVEDIKEAIATLNLFLNNKHDEATKRVIARGERGLYSSVSLGTIRFLRAFITFEPNDIAQAVTTLKRTTALCNRRRKKSAGMAKMMKKPNFNSYNEEEIQAELCYAESLLLRAIVTFIQDDNLISFVKGGLRFRKSYRTYKVCQDILESRTFNNDFLKRNFHCGVLMGVGAFNLIISMLPKRILKLVEFVGFSGKRDVGNKMLDEGQKMQDCVRGPICSMFMLAHHCFLTYVFGRGCTDIPYVESVLKPWFTSYPESGVLAIAKARLEVIKGNIKDGVPLLEAALKIPLDWKNFYHVTYFELQMINGLLGDYRKALHYAEILYKENQWSKVSTSYGKAILLYSCSDVSDGERKELEQILRNLHTLKRKFSGKSNPIEKFFIRKADRYFAQNNSLVLPAYELLYVSNYMILLKGKTDILNGMLKNIEKAIADVKAKPDSKYYADNYCLALFLKGLCIGYSGKPQAAEDCFKEVLQNQKKIKEDTYIPVCANLELGLISIDAKNYSQADLYLKTAKKEKTFWPEFRIHQAREEIKALKK